MKTTYFRPSIHGWTFGNDWTRSLPYDIYTLDNMGFCGGMCWVALRRFYNAVPIPRDTPKPSEGDALYNEIWDAQVRSVIGTLGKMLNWQCSPDRSHWWTPHSLGHLTKEDWKEKVRKSLDASKPVTITLITSSSDCAPWHLDNNHRAVAYAYNIGSPGGDAPKGATSKVTIWIYDPNYKNDDDVKLTFYRGAERNRIKLRHNRGDEVHGFFKDDEDIGYQHSDTTKVQIDNCIQTGISSRTRADYDLKFSWQCRFIPYFNIIIDDTSWKYNTGVDLARSQYQPTDEDNKQCPSRMGSLTVSLKLPRDVSTVAVRLLRDDTYYESIEVDALPAIKCYPYIRSRTLGEAPCVCDYDIEDTDLFIKDPNPSDDTVEQLDTSEFRWVMNISKRGYVGTNRLGNVIVPILANFEERNLAPPTVKSGTVQTYRNLAPPTVNSGTGQPYMGVVTTTTLDSLAEQAQKIFDGFQDNPSDYDNGTRVEFTYKSIDHFNVVAQGKAIFYGKSILYELPEPVVFGPFYDPSKLEAIAREMVERGIIIPWPEPRPFPPFVPVKLLKKLLGQRQIQGMIDQAFQSSWGDQRIWKQIWNDQSKLLEEAEKSKTIHIEGMTEKGKVLKATKDLQEKQQRELDAVVLNIVVNRTMKKLRTRVLLASVIILTVLIGLALSITRML